MSKDEMLKLAHSLVTDVRGVFQDERGVLIAQDARHVVSYSKPRVIRGMHFQKTPQEKQVMVVVGHIFDVIVDCRPRSPSFGKAIGFHLPGPISPSVEEAAPSPRFVTLRVPAGFAHGFISLCDSIVQYRLSADYDDAQQGGFSCFAGEAGEAFRRLLEAKFPGQEAIVSEKDRQQPESISPDDFPFFANLG